MTEKIASPERIKEFGEEPNHLEAPLWRGVTPRDKLILARWILLITAILFLLSGVAFLVNPQYGAIIFDACKTILPPIVTLVLGYYFGESNRRS